jgi:hypothetical protein
MGDVDQKLRRCFGRFARHIARALSMPHQPYLLGPLLFHARRSGKVVRPMLDEFTKARRKRA